MFLKYIYMFKSGIFCTEYLILFFFLLIFIFHIVSSNDVALAFYASHGFEQGEVIIDYYKKIDPPHCYVLRKAITPCKQSNDQDKTD